MEGALRRVVSSQHERNSTARLKCIQHYGANCFICGFSFEAAYGEIGRGFIHVHHLVPVSSIGKTYQINPINDLRPVCPNCHAMLHSKDPPLAVEELRSLVSRGTDA
ncbi:MAG: HNH endonuclease [Burkholderiales bacterium]|nr:HNH endonuclease [Burkholderiales bacterium]